jgi:hypothetical protein
MPINYEPPAEIFNSIPRRELFWLLVATFASVDVAAEIQRPQRMKLELPACEPLPNPFSPAFSSDFGAGVGMQCATSELPASPKIIIRTTPPSVTIGRPGM